MTLFEQTAKFSGGHKTPVLEHIDLSQPPAAILEQTLPVVGQTLGCDLVFLYLRSPRRQVGRVPFCWRRHDEIPLVYDPDWKLEPNWLPRQDPMFRAALEGRPSLFIEDIETVDPSQVNAEFERQTFGHRALVHGHLYQKSKLWGILQPCVFYKPRPWSREERLMVKRTIGWLTLIAMEFVSHAYPS